MEPPAGEVCAVLRQTGEQGLIAAGAGFDFAFGAIQRGHFCQGHAEQNPFCLIAGVEFSNIYAPAAAAGSARGGPRSRFLALPRARQQKRIVGAGRVAW